MASRFEKAKAAYEPRVKEHQNVPDKPLDPNQEILRAELEDALRAYAVTLGIAPEDAQILKVKMVEDVGQNEDVTYGKERAFISFDFDQPELERRLALAQIEQHEAILQKRPERPADEFVTKWGGKTNHTGQSYRFRPFEGLTDNVHTSFDRLRIKLDDNSIYEMPRPNGGFKEGRWHLESRNHYKAPYLEGHSLENMVEILNQKFFKDAGIQPVDYEKIFAKSVKGSHSGNVVARRIEQDHAAKGV